MNDSVYESSYPEINKYIDIEIKRRRINIDFKESCIYFFRYKMWLPWNCTSEKIISLRRWRNVELIRMNIFLSQVLKLLKKYK